MPKFRKALKFCSYLLGGLVVLLLVSAGAFCVLFLGTYQTTPPNDLASHIPEDGVFNVEIIRDEFGVPHILGKTDADCAYGLAWAQCEDDFKSTYDVFLMGRGASALSGNPKLAAVDYMVKLFQLGKIVTEQYDADLSPEVKAICEAYAVGVNHYCATHPDEVPVWDEFPARGEDVALGFALKTPLLGFVDRELRFLADEFKPVPAAHLLRIAQYQDALLPERDMDIGSNTFAVGPARTEDGSAYLNVNPHVPFEGPVTWYEAHVKSEEGLDATGGLFPGSPFILHGHNRDLGWAMTVNAPDTLDVFELTLNPEDKYQYRFDGDWKDLKIFDIDLKIPLFGSYTADVTMKGFESIHGPVIHIGPKAFAVRYSTWKEIRQVEEWYRFNKARNLEEFLDALSMRAIASLNIGYADKDLNIMYFYNASIPIRAEGYDWRKPVPGDTSETLWTELIPFDTLPRVVNPKSGFIQNCNGTPYMTTIGDDNPREEDYSETCGIDKQMMNRGYRALELLAADDSITYEDFYNIKFDKKFSKDSLIPKFLQELFDNPPESDDPLIEEGLALLKTFDMEADLEDTAMALVTFTLVKPILAQIMGTESPPVQETFLNGVETLHRNFGRLDVPWKEVNLLIRGDKRLPLGGGADTLRCALGPWNEDEKAFKAYLGDTHVLLVRFDPEGNVHSESIHQYGSATLDETSPHYSDQSPLYAAERMKPTWFDIEELLKHVESRYRPGEARSVISHRSPSPDYFKGACRKGTDNAAH